MFPVGDIASPRPLNHLSRRPEDVPNKSSSYASVGISRSSTVAHVSTIVSCVLLSLCSDNKY